MVTRVFHAAVQPFRAGREAPSADQPRRVERARAAGAVVRGRRPHAWTLTRDKVQYAVMTAQPNNDNGNTLIYGHYRREVFSRLRFVAPDAEAIVITDNGYKFVYKFKSFKVVQPSDGTIFKYKGKPQLTLQTCTGVFFQNRQLFDFDFVRYEKV